MLTRLRRIFKHRWQADARHTLAPAMLARLTHRVTQSEQCHSGEIRIYVEAGLPLSYLWQSASFTSVIRTRALSLFSKLRVWDTANNNGVLIYLLLAERSLEIVADRGLNAAVSEQHWQRIAADMRTAFTANDFEGGLMHAVQEVEQLLLLNFPLSTGNKNPNELPDHPVLG